MNYELRTMNHKFGFVWLCFFVIPKLGNLHNLLINKILRLFCPFENWLCFFKTPRINLGAK